MCDRQSLVLDLDELGHDIVSMVEQLEGGRCLVEFASGARLIVPADVLRKEGD